MEFNTGGLRSFSFKSRLYQRSQGGVQFFAFEAVQHLLEKPEDEKLVGALAWDAPRKQVELLLGVDPAGRGAVGAPDVVCLNLEAGKGIGLCLVAQHQVAVALVGVRLLRVLIDDDESGKDRPRRVEKGVLVEEIR